MVTDLAEVRRLAGLRKEENTAFRRHLRAHHVPDGPFHIIAGEIGRQIDCTKCANCCRELTVEVNRADIARIAKELGMEEADAKRLYTVRDPADPTRRLLAQPEGACVFLDGNLCMIYDARPPACREFPHAALTKRSLGGRVESLCRKSAICPIVFNSLEAYKHLVGFHARDSQHAAANSNSPADAARAPSNDSTANVRSSSNPNPPVNS